MGWNLLFLFHRMKGSGLFYYYYFCISSVTNGMAHKCTSLIPFICSELGTRAGKVRSERKRRNLPPLNICKWIAVMPSSQVRCRTKFNFVDQCVCVCSYPCSLGRENIVIQCIKTISRGWSSSPTCHALSHKHPDPPDHTQQAGHPLPTPKAGLAS